MASTNGECVDSLARVLVGRVDVVIINSISKQAFHQLLSPSTTPEIAAGEQVEWFADRTEIIIGTVSVCGRSQCWTYAILRRDTMGDFRVFNCRERFWTPHAARVKLLREMVGAEARGAEPVAA
jgi:hypothetical protein